MSNKKEELVEEVFIVKPCYQELPIRRKAAILKLLSEWANKELDKLPRLVTGVKKVNKQSSKK
jgi:hypothetical protein